MSRLVSKRLFLSSCWLTLETKRRVTYSSHLEAEQKNTKQMVAAAVVSSLVLFFLVIKISVSRMLDEGNGRYIQH